jgi:hypothetical protein
MAPANEIRPKGAQANKTQETFVGHSLDLLLAAALQADALVVFECGADWPEDLASDLVGRHGVVVMVQQPEESYPELLYRIRRRAERQHSELGNPIGHVVWVGNEVVQIPWQELLRSLFADEELNTGCVFRAYGSGVMLQGDRARASEPPRRSTLRATQKRRELGTGTDE